jgi:hypothetical protein
VKQSTGQNISQSNSFQRRVNRGDCIMYRWLDHLAVQYEVEVVK